jgi:hypothetical protein
MPAFMQADGKAFDIAESTLHVVGSIQESNIDGHYQSIMSSSPAFSSLVGDLLPCLPTSRHKPHFNIDMRSGAIITQVLNDFPPH